MKLTRITPDLRDAGSVGECRSERWKWLVCGMLLMATMLNYMDRQTLSLTIVDISRELGLTSSQYGTIEFVFGMAFATGGIVLGLLADRFDIRWLYPCVLIGWSLAGIATSYALPIGQALSNLRAPSAGPIIAGAESQALYLGLVACRGMLGFFEAGQWPCALITTQRLLSPADRTLGNSLLQSGASIGAILTPAVVQLLVTSQPGSWRSPFIVIGTIGILWIVPWLMLIRGTDLRLPTTSFSTPDERRRISGFSFTMLRRLSALVVVVITINLTWHFFRAWLPKLLREYHGYDRTIVNVFTSAFYIASDIGCIAVGFASRLLVKRWRFSVHESRMATFIGCALLTSLTTVAASVPRGPILLGSLMAIAFGSLGLFPTYYSLTQEISARHQGKVVGLLGATTWVFTACMQKLVGETIDRTGSYATAIFAAGLAPLIGLAALWMLWPRDS